MYSPWIFFSLGSVYYFYSIFCNKREEGKKHNKKDIFFFALYSLLSLYTSFYTVLLFVFQFLYVLFHRGNKKVLTGFSVIMGIVFLSFFPYLIIYINNLIDYGQVHEICFKKESSILFIPYALNCFSLGTSYGPSLAELHFSRSIKLFLSYPSFALAMALFGVLFLSGLYYIRKSNCFLFFSLYFLVPFLFPFIVSLISKSISFNVRHTIIALPSFLTIIAYGIRNLCIYADTSPFLIAVKKYVPLTLLVVLSFYSLNNYYFNPRYYKDDIRNAALHVEKNELSGDKLFIPSSFREFGYYYRGSSEIVMKAEGKNLWVILMREWEYPRLKWDNVYAEKEYTEFPGVKIYKLEEIEDD